MTVYLNGAPAQLPDTLPDGFAAVALLSPTEAPAALAKLAVPPGLHRHAERDISRFESHAGLDFISLAPPAFSKLSAPVLLYCTGAVLTFICESAAHSELDAYLARAFAQRDKPTPGMVLCRFLLQLTEGDFLQLDKIELQIAALEDALVQDQTRRYPEKITRLRRGLLAHKRYYESLCNLLEDLQENQNGLLQKPELKVLQLAAGRADRLYHMVMNLRDYVTQVRESYQAQIDLELNGVMKIFTVVTSVFLPLSLIVGWYGMNVAMPEMGWSGIYPAIITGSVLTVAAALMLYKRKKWF